jgi:uncharacterized protein (DUF2267 family)
MNYNEMVRTFAGATALTRSHADAALVDTLTVLSEVLSPEETRDLLAQLPKSVRERVPVSSESLTMRPIEFVARVADLSGLSIEEAERHARVTFEILSDAVNAGEMNDIAEQLGPEYAELLGRSERVAREQAAARSADGLPAQVIGAVNRALRAGAHLIRGPIDTGLRVAGLKR